MEQSSELVGTLDDVNQEEAYEPLPLPAAVVVQQDGPVQVHMVPSVSGGSRAFALVLGDVKRIANEDPRRRSITIIGTQPFNVGASDNEARSGYGALWPANVPLVMTHSEEVYVRITADGTISAISENWAS